MNDGEELLGDNIEDELEEDLKYVWCNLFHLSTWFFYMCCAINLTKKACLGRYNAFFKDKWKVKKSDAIDEVPT